MKGYHFTAAIVKEGQEIQALGMDRLRAWRLQQPVTGTTPDEPRTSAAKFCCNQRTEMIRAKYTGDLSSI